MANPRLILCGGAALSSRSGTWQAAQTHRVCVGTGRHDVHLDLSHLSRRLASHLPPVAADLLEVATYVYAADQMVRRGGPREFEYGSKWHRRFRFEIPVRARAAWGPEVAAELASTLGYLTDDTYEFGFTSNLSPVPIESYVTDDLPFDTPSDWEEVVLFSGGADSLCGAVLEVLQSQRKVVLVSHRPVSKVYARQRDLVGDLANLVRPPGRRPLHVAVEVNKGKPLGREFTQRSRSFLFASLAAVVARMFGLTRVRFFENGVTSLNLPPSPQVIGGQASRTTHPRVLAGFERVFSLLFGEAMEVDNPFRWKTKATVLRELKAAGHGRLCARTVSCAHTWQQTTAHPHCGLCSQCVDRRLTAVAAGLTDDEDRPDTYRRNVLTDPRAGQDLVLAERYVGMAREVDTMAGPEDFLQAYPQVTEALPHTGLSDEDGLAAAFKLYKDHAREVLDGLATAVTGLSKQYVRGRFPADSLLAVAGVQGLCLAASSTSARPQPPSVNGSTDEPLRIDHDRFAARWHGLPCELGNTKEFALLVRLSRKSGIYVPIHTLAADVWEDDQTEKTAIQRVASNLRRKLHEAGWAGVSIDGGQAGHYRLAGADGPAPACSSASARTQR